MAVDMFIKIGDIEGESEDKNGHAKEIDVLAWSWGASNAGTGHTGGGSGGGKVNVQDLSLTKYVDASSNLLLKAVCDGGHFPEANLVVRKAGGEKLEYIKIKMEHVIVTSLSTGGSGGEDRLTENISLNFKKVKLVYTEQASEGAADGGEKEFGWDIAGGIAT